MPDGVVRINRYCVECLTTLQDAEKVCRNCGSRKIKEDFQETARPFTPTQAICTENPSLG